MHLLVGGECVYRHTEYVCLQYTCQHGHQDVTYATDTTHVPIHVCHVSTCAYRCPMSLWVSLYECECTCEFDHVCHIYY